MYNSLEITSGLTMDDLITFPYGRDVKEGAKTQEQIPCTTIIKKTEQYQNERE